MLSLFRKPKPIEATAPDPSPLRDAILQRLEQVRRAGASNPLIAHGLMLVIPHLAQLTETDLTTMVDALHGEAVRLYEIAHPDEDT